MLNFSCFIQIFHVALFLGLIMYKGTVGFEAACQICTSVCVPYIKLRQMTMTYLNCISLCLPHIQLNQ